MRRWRTFDWVGGAVLVRGKGGRVDRMPLPVDVGEALVSYLRDGSPATGERTVFVRAVAPFTPLGSSSVSCIVGRAARAPVWAPCTVTGCGTPPRARP